MMKKLIISFCAFLALNSSLFGGQTQIFKVANPAIKTGDKQAFDQLVEVSLGSRIKQTVGLGKKEAQEKVKDLKFLQMYILNHVTHLIDQLNLDKIRNNVYAIKTDKIKAAIDEYFEKNSAVHDDVVMKAYRYAVFNFDKQLNEFALNNKLTIPELNLLYLHGKDITPSQGVVNIWKKGATVLAQALHDSDLNKKYGQIVSALEKLNVKVKPAELSLVEIKRLNE